MPVKNLVQMFYLSTKHRQFLFEPTWYLLGFLVVLALGLSNLYYPFGADQATFILGANALNDGATLYVDY